MSACPKPYQAAFTGSKPNIEQVFRQDIRAQIETVTDCLSDYLTPEALPAMLPRLQDVDVLFGTWGMPFLSDELLDAMPNLKAVFYAAGTIAYFADRLLARGMIVSSAWHANATPVAEFTVSQILLSCKGYFRNVRDFRAGGSAYREAFRGPGAFGETVALLGLGAVGSKVAEMLQNYRLQVIAFDKFLDEASFARLGVKQVTLTEAFQRAFVISNHLADNPETVGLIDDRLLRTMRPHATFINTGRGKTVNHPDLIACLKARPDLTALLDVTDPEPLPSDSELFQVPNALVSSHIAGSINDEVQRLSECAFSEFCRFVQGQPLQYRVTRLE